MNTRFALAPCLLALLPAALPAQEVYGGTRKAVDLGEYKGFVLVPPTPGPAGSRPWVWYAPVLGNNPSPNTGWMLRQLIKDGFYVAGVNVGESMGSPAGRKGYTAFYEHVVKEFGLEPKALPEHNPVDRLGPLAKAKVPILHVHGDVDKAVPLDKNSQAVYDRYRGLGGPMELIVVKGKGHEAVKEFFEEPRLVAFLKAGGLPDPPDKK